VKAGPRRIFIGKRCTETVNRGQDRKKKNQKKNGGKRKKKKAPKRKGLPIGRFPREAKSKSVKREGAARGGLWVKKRKGRREKESARGGPETLQGEKAPKTFRTLWWHRVAEEIRVKMCFARTSTLEERKPREKKRDIIEGTRFTGERNGAP